MNKSTETIKQARIGRRDFLAGALAVGAAAAIPALSGCSTTSLADTGSEAPAAKLVSPMSEAERAEAIADSTYMGGETDYYGMKLERTTGPAGQSTTSVVTNYISQVPDVFEQVRDRVWVSHAYALCNAVMIEGETGMILIETSGHCEGAAKDLELFRTVTDKPVSAIIYSHDHYVFGTSVYVPEGNPDNIPIVAHENLLNHVAETIGAIAPAYSLRARQQFGAMLPSDGPDALIMASYSGAKKETLGFVEPNTFIPGDVPMTEMKLDGLTFRFYPGSSDSPCSLSIYCVELDTLYSNHVFPCFFNMYTLRGEKYRDPDTMIPELDLVRTIHPEYFIACQGLFLTGRDEIDRQITLYRGSLQFVYDQTIRYMNKGYGPDEITKLIKVPSFLVQGLFTAPIYGEVEHHIRGIYRGLIGWWANDTTDLHPVTKQFENAKLVEALGGDDAVAAAANAALEDSQYAWAATLAGYVLTNNPDHAEARAAKAEALRQMAYVTHSTITRSFMMTQAYELEGNTVDGVSTAFGAVSKDKLAVCPRTHVLDMIRVTLDAEKALDKNVGLALTYTDENVTNSIIVRNCVAAVEEGRSDAVTTEVQTDYPTMMSILAKEKTLADCFADGSVVVVGDQAAYDEFAELFEAEL